jgi:hypothetical protein
LSTMVFSKKKKGRRNRLITKMVKMKIK